MSTAELKVAVTGGAEKPKDFPAMLIAWLPEIKRALPKHLNGDRMSRIALTAFRRTPKLAGCDPRSVFAAVIQASQLGLEPDTLGRSYLIPYDRKIKTSTGWKTVTECAFIPGWKGLVDLMTRSGQGTVYTGVIFRDQEYRYRDGSMRELEITNETSLVDPADITHVFAVGHIKGGMFPVIELWRMAKVIKHRDRYNKVGDKHYSFGNLEMYARKVVLLQVLKYMPCSPELATAMALNDSAEIGAQHIDLKDAIEGTWEPTPDEDAESEQPKSAGTEVAGADLKGASKAGEKSAAEATDQQDADIDKLTEPKDKAPTITAAKLHDDLVRAKSVDDVDTAISVIDQAPTQFRDELRAAAKARREELS